MMTLGRPHVLGTGNDIPLFLVRSILVMVAKFIAEP